jgi:hypothetical protein
MRNGTHKCRMAARNMFIFQLTKYLTITILDIIHRSYLYSYLKHDISVTEFCHHLLVKPAQLVPPEDGDRIQSPKRRVNKRQNKGCLEL